MFCLSPQRSSRGRVIKPAQTTMTSSFQSCSDLYSYDWHGNFTGVSAVIDLTSDDDPLPKTRRHRRIKKEPTDESTANDLNTTANCTIGPASTNSKPIQAKKAGGESSNDIVPAAPRPVVKKGRKRGKISRKLYCEDLEGTGGSESEAGQLVEPQQRKSDSETVDLHGQQVEAQRKKMDSHASSRDSEGEMEEGVRENTSHGPGKKDKGRYLSDSEGEHSQHPVKRHAHQTRGKGRRRAARALISDDSEVELENGTTHQGQRLPPASDETNAEPHLRSRLHPETESCHRRLKIHVGEPSILDMSDVASSRQGVKEGDRRMRYHVRTLSSGGGDEILTHVVEKSGALSDKDLHRLTQ